MDTKNISIQELIEALKLIQTQGGVHQSQLWKQMNVSSRKGANIAEFLDKEGFVQRIETNHKKHNTYLILPSVIYPGILDEHMNVESYGRLSEATLSEISNFHRSKSLSQDNREYQNRLEVFDVNTSKDGRITIPSQKREIYSIEKDDIVDIIVETADGSVFPVSDIVVGNKGQIHIPSRKRELYEMTDKNVNLTIFIKNQTVNDIGQ